MTKLEKILELEWTWLEQHSTKSQYEKITEKVVQLIKYKNQIEEIKKLIETNQKANTYKTRKETWTIPNNHLSLNVKTVLKILKMEKDGNKNNETCLPKS